MAFGETGCRGDARCFAGDVGERNRVVCRCVDGVDGQYLYSLLLAEYDPQWIPLAARSRVRVTLREPIEHLLAPHWFNTLVGLLITVGYLSHLHT